jgi:hypothetical protein
MVSQERRKLTLFARQEEHLWLWMVGILHCRMYMHCWVIERNSRVTRMSGERSRAVHLMDNYVHRRRARLSYIRSSVFRHVEFDWCCSVFIRSEWKSIFGCWLANFKRKVTNHIAPRQRGNKRLARLCSSFKHSKRRERIIKHLADSFWQTSRLSGFHYNLNLRSFDGPIPNAKATNTRSSLEPQSLSLMKI